MLLDAKGRKLGERDFAHNGEGLAAMAAWITAQTGAAPAAVSVAIEVPHGPVVESLLERGFCVHAINPKQLDWAWDWPASVDGQWTCSGGLVIVSLGLAPLSWTPMMLLHEVFPDAQDTSTLRAGVPAADDRSAPHPGRVPPQQCAGALFGRLTRFRHEIRWATPTMTRRRDDGVCRIGRLAMQIVAHLDMASHLPLQVQIADQLKALIHGGQLKPGRLLPSSRELGRQLGVSRNTVSEAFERLIAEGYVETTPAKGTYVRAAPPRRGTDAGMTEAGVPAIAVNLPLPYSARGLPGLYAAPNPAVHIDFRFGRSDARSFPEKTWRRLLLECFGSAAERLSQYNDPAGLAELRVAIADFVGPGRGIIASPERILIVNGFQQGINLAAHLLVGIDTPVAIEAPCYRGAAFLFESYGGRVIPVPIDEAGIDVARLPTHRVKLVYVTPSHQFPSGVTMTLERRLALLEWAARAGAYILEVDYDSDFRFEGQVLPSLFALDRNNCVIYINSFSRSLGPGLRLGYMVLPRHLLHAASTLKALIDNGCPWLEQATLAQFMRNGSLTSHIDRLRQTYARRRDAALASIALHFGASSVSGHEGGTHMLWQLPESVGTAAALRERALKDGIGLHPLSDGAVHHHQALAGSERSLLLGYVHLSETQIAQSIARIAAAAR